MFKKKSQSQKKVLMTSSNNNLQKRFIKGIIQGNPVILNEIYKTYTPKIKEYITRKGGKVEDAQDVFQEALIIIYQKAQLKEFELKSSFYSFLFGICRNLWLQKIIPETKNKAKIPPLEMVIEVNHSEVEIKKERYRLYEKCLKQLSPDNRTILELSAQELSNKEIAEKMGIESYGYLRIKKMRAKKELITLIQKDILYKELCQFDM